MFVPHLHTPDSIFSYSHKAMNFEEINKCRVAVVQRLCTLENLKAIDMMKSRGLKLVYDLDDNMWRIPQSNPAYDMSKKLRMGFAHCALQCDVLTVSTYPLKLAAKEELVRYNKGRRKMPNIEVVENCIDFDWFKPLPIRLRSEETVTVGWAGTNSHVGDVAKVFQLLPQALDRFPKMRLEIVGLPATSALASHPRFKQRNFVPVSEYPARWASWQWDMSLAPLEDNTFNRSKSNIKMLEAGAMGIPCLVSPSVAYRDFITNSGDTGRTELLRRHVLCEGPADWTRNLAALVQDAPLREAVGASMMAAARRFDIKKGIEKWASIFGAL